MSNQHQEILDTPELSQKDKIIQALEQQLVYSNNMLEQQKQQNKQLKEKMILQDQLNTQLSNFHLTSHFENRDNKTLSNKKEEELSKAQEHIMILGHILLKNKKTIQRLKKLKIKDETFHKQITELIQEKNYLWNIVLAVHENFTQQPLLEDDIKEHKAQEVLALLNNTKKKIKP